MLTQKILNIIFVFALSTCKGPVKVDRVIELLINVNVCGKCVAVILLQHSDSDHIRPQSLNDGAANLLRRLLRHFDDDT
jgi:hypothetical protein